MQQSKAKMGKRLDLAQGRIPAALALVRDVQAAIVLGKPMADQIDMLDALAETLLGLEDAVGVVTPASLFE